MNRRPSIDKLSLDIYTSIGKGSAGNVCSGAMMLQVANR